MKTKNIVLIGMPGAGKSTVGVVLAKIMGYHFLDSDLIIQEEDGRLLHEIIEEDGLDEFINIENRINQEIVADKTVIATGGSAVYGTEAMRHFAETGVVVYIQIEYETIQERLGNIAQRGVAIREKQTLFDLYEERTPLYRQYADVIVNGSNNDIGILAKEIVRKVRESH